MNPGVDATRAPAVVAQATTPEGAPAAPSQTPSKKNPGSRSHEDQVETRIKELHQKLKITTAQESQWNSFAQVMRESAQAVDAVLKERAENLHAMNAVEDLRSYEKPTRTDLRNSFQPSRPSTTACQRVRRRRLTPCSQSLRSGHGRPANDRAASILTPGAASGSRGTPAERPRQASQVNLDPSRGSFCAIRPTSFRPRGSL
jgi:hypothetical protein